MLALVQGVGLFKLPIPMKLRTTGLIMIRLDQIMKNISKNLNLAAEYAVFCFSGDNRASCQFVLVPISLR